MESIRSLVRPSLTWVFGAAFIYAAFNSTGAVEVLSAPTFMMIGFWFNDRVKERLSGTVDA